MFYKNARIFTSDFQFHMGGFSVAEDGRFGEVLPHQIPEDAIDLNGATVIPGLIDIHNHGNSGEDFSDGDLEGIAKMAHYLARNGITSFAATTMTLPYPVLEAAFSAAAKFARESRPNCARLLGIQMEGPYFSEKKKGAQNGAYLKKPDFTGFKKLYDGCNGLVKIVDIAPELEGAEEFIKQAKEFCTVSVAHTDAGYEDAKCAFSAGAALLTHLFNGMPGIHHRNPGVIPAAAENSNVFAELICDGYHIHPAAVRLAFSMFGRERMVLISDALRCCGMPDGTYELGGQEVILSGGVARLCDGTLAGSSTNLYECMRRAMSFGIPEADAVRAATYNPACVLKESRRVGAIAPGMIADFLVCSADYSQRKVYLGGKLLTRS